ncbi:MAG: GCV T protein [Gammaproteobacteria bacterium]|nr:GCV T protein [Gammaproteobacteria bacterium]
MLAEWRTFLLSQGARFEDGEVVDFGATDREATVAFSGPIIMDLSFLAVITISGKDATAFLNGQFTTDVTQLADGGVQFSAWCNPKGQVIANFILTRIDEDYHLLLPRELQESFLARLRRYVLRAAVTIMGGKDTMPRLGVQFSGETAGVPFQSEGASRADSLVIVPVPASRNRWISFGTVADLGKQWLTLAQQATATGSYTWRLCDIQDAIPWITSATAETCLPQMLNLDLLQGLSYKKGCFPGQEIIARLHYRGKYSQRLFIARLDTTVGIAPGTKIFTVDKSQSIGTIITSARHPEQGCSALVILEVNYVNPELLCLENSSARFLQISTPPYLSLNQE